jgi:PAT family beta-lactamase induction signal transducer AmpG
LTLGFFTMAFLNPAHFPWALAMVALSVAIFSASQDVVIDAYKTDLLPQTERGLGVALNTVGYRVAMLVAGALALIMAAELGWRFTYFCMAGLMLLGMLVTLRTPAVPHVAPPKTFMEAVREPFMDFFTSRAVSHAILILIFVAIYKISEALSLSLNTYFLLKGVGFTLLEVGSVSKIALLAGGVLGSVVGGILLKRLSLYYSLMIFGLLQMTSNLAFILLLVFAKSIFLMGAVMFVESFFSALGSVAFVVFLMGLCNKKYTATQYALLSAVSALGRVLLGPLAAVMVNHVGWSEFYIWTFIMGLPALLILMWLNHQPNFTAYADRFR